jgi:hypothetical protein
MPDSVVDFLQAELPAASIAVPTDACYVVSALSSADVKLVLPCKVPYRNPFSGFYRSCSKTAFFEFRDKGRLGAVYFYDVF